MTAAVIDLADETTLVERIASSARPITFLFGSGISLGSPDRPGVPGCAGMVDLIREALGRTAPALDKLLMNESDAGAQYRFAMRHLLQTRGQDDVNAVVRRAVGFARKTPPQDLSIEGCRALELDFAGWHFNAAMDILAALYTLPQHPIDKYSNRSRRPGRPSA
jgi:hypothetical protein